MTGGEQSDGHDDGQKGVDGFHQVYLGFGPGGACLDRTSRHMQMHGPVHLYVTRIFERTNSLT